MDRQTDMTEKKVRLLKISLEHVPDDSDKKKTGKIVETFFRQHFFSDFGGF